MIWTGGNNPQSLLSALQAQVNKDREINSSYGNPYLCSFGPLTMNASNPKGFVKVPLVKEVVIEARGSCHRVYR